MLKKILSKKISRGLHPSNDNWEKTANEIMQFLENNFKKKRVNNGN